MQSMHRLMSTWNPLQSPDWDTRDMSYSTLLRIKNDLGALLAHRPPGIWTVFDEEDISKLHAVISGPKDTPYAGGFFYFVIRCPPDYPLNPPRVKMMTTCNDTVRFNPNIYRDGKVCLSILGTWAGPTWSPALDLSAVLLSIQSLMNSEPYHNEPGYEKGPTGRNVNTQDVNRYNEIIQHETIRVAVCDVLENANNDTKDLPKELRQEIDKSFAIFYPHFEEVVKKKLDMTNQTMRDPFGEQRGVFDYQSLLIRLQKLKTEYIDSVQTTEAEFVSDLDETK